MIFKLIYLMVIITIVKNTVSTHILKNDDSRLIVETPMGKIQGSIIESRLGKPIFSFRGIRYAKAPINNLRFQPPIPIEEYKDIYNATADGPMCPQPGFGGPYSEDCLLLNVYSTELPTSTSKAARPVIIFLHAGGWYSGTGRSNWYGPQYFMDQDIVLVTLNYRLGSLGFLSTGDKFAPGNNGLKDQVVAMKWVQKNIASFGGDPNSVTLMGYSAGSWSVTLHMVSPMSKGLFHKAIASSGSMIGIWPIPKQQMDLAKKQARILNCPETSSEIIINCLKNQSADALGNSLNDFFEFDYSPILIWSAVIEEDFGQERFLPDHPINLIKAGQLMDIPFVTGVTKDEFAGPAISIVGNQTLLSKLDQNWETYAPICFIYERNTEKSRYVSRISRDFYLGDDSLTNASLTGLAQLFADGVIGYSNNRIVKLYSEKKSQPNYYYRFSYPGRYSHVYLPNTNTPYGVVHHDDLIYLFFISPIFPLFNNSYPEVEMVDKLTTLYTNFARTGNPTPSETTSKTAIRWETFNLKSEKYLDIGKTLEIKEKLYDDRYSFWEKLYPTDQI